MIQKKVMVLFLAIASNTLVHGLSEELFLLKQLHVIEQKLRLIKEFYGDYLLDRGVSGKLYDSATGAVSEKLFREAVGAVNSLFEQVGSYAVDDGEKSNIIQAISALNSCVSSVVSARQSTHDTRRAGDSCCESDDLYLALHLMEQLVHEIATMCTSLSSSFNQVDVYGREASVLALYAFDEELLDFSASVQSMIRDTMYEFDLYVSDIGRRSGILVSDTENDLAKQHAVFRQRIAHMVSLWNDCVRRRMSVVVEELGLLGNAQSERNCYLARQFGEVQDAVTATVQSVQNSIFENQQSIVSLSAEIGSENSELLGLLQDHDCRMSQDHADICGKLDCLSLSISEAFLKAAVGFNENILDAGQAILESIPTGVVGYESVHIPYFAIFTQVNLINQKVLQLIAIEVVKIVAMVII